MGDLSFSDDALSLLGRVYRQRASGLLLIGPEGERVRVAMRDGQIVALGPLRPAAGGPVTPVAAGRPADRPPLPPPDDSVALRLQRILLEIGLRKASPPPPAPPEPSSPPAAPPDLRARLLAALVERRAPAEFVSGTETPDDVAPIAGATEPLLLEAVKRLPGGQTVRDALGDLDQRLLATTALAEERTLTLTEGYLLSRIDGQSTAREVLQLVPLDPDDTERTLLGLLLTGRVEYRPAPHRKAARPEAVPVPPASSPAPEDQGAEPPGLPPPEEGPGGPPPTTVHEMDPETLEQRREILELFQSLPLKNHFEVLGLQQGCSDADVKRTYNALVKRFHPDVHHDPRLEDLRDVLEAIFIRIGEAWEVLGSARSRAAYEARFVPIPGSAAAPGDALPTDPGAAGPESRPSARAGAAIREPHPYVMPEETLSKARLLLAQLRYWDAIQILEAAVPHMQPQRSQHRGRILLARAYAKNPNWLRQAQDQLREVVREDPENADALYELGLVYKASGLVSRAQAMFRRTIEVKADHREAAAELQEHRSPSPSGGGLLKKLFRRGRAS